MITDDQARLLLARAAETIDVDEPDVDSARGPIRRPAWLVPLGVAAAVLVVIGAGLAFGRLGPDAGPAPADRRTGEPVEQPHVPEPGELPGLIGYTAAEARDELQERGLRVVEKPVRDGCQPEGIVTSTSPGQTAAVEPGDTVTLRVTQSAPMVDCVGEPPWGAIWPLVRFARGLDDEPPVDDAVRLTVDGRDAVTLSADEAADPTAWTVCPADGLCHSALAALQQMLSAPAVGAAATEGLTLAVGLGIECPGKTNSVSLTTRLGRDLGPRECPLPAVSIEPYGDGVTAVDVQTAGERQFATDPTESQRAVAAAFVAWLRDDSADLPPLADEVTILRSDVRLRAFTGEQAADGAVFLPCSATDSFACGQSPAALLRDRAADLTYALTPVGPCRGRSSSFGGSRVLRPAAEGRLLTISSGDECGGEFAIELTLDDEGAIESINTFPPTG